MMDSNRPFPCGNTRREFFTQMGNGFFGTALAGMLAQEGLLAAGNSPTTLSRPHHTPKAKACIFLFMVGGPSHIDTFDPKPELVRRHGRQHDFGGASQITQTAVGQLMGSPFRFPRSGKSGLPISEILPTLAECADDLCILRSLHTDTAAHGAACLQMNTGFPRPGFPSMGSWATYGLGHDNQNLPGFVVLSAGQPPYGGRLNWTSGFLPRGHDGTLFAPGNRPLSNLQPASNGAEQRSQLELLEQINRRHLDRDPGNTELSARIASYELAFRLQTSAPEAVDLTSESNATQQLYGLHERSTESFGRQCLLARRLVERGVRFVELFHQNWDTHGNNDNEHRRLCRAVDVPIAGLLKDLKARGLLDETLVVWGGEFGRTPVGGGGRNHHANAFSMWVAGGGIKGGISCPGPNSDRIRCRIGAVRILGLLSGDCRIPVNSGGTGARRGWRCDGVGQVARQSAWRGTRSGGSWRGETRRRE